MYDSHIHCKEYKGFKKTIANIVNGDDMETDVEKLANHIQEVYDAGNMQSSQYDELMGYLQDLIL